MKIRITVIIVNQHDGLFTSKIIPSSKADYLLSVRSKHFDSPGDENLTDDDIECYMMNELSECFAYEHIIDIENFSKV